MKKFKGFGNVLISKGGKTDYKKLVKKAHSGDKEATKQMKKLPIPR